MPVISMHKAWVFKGCDRQNMFCMRQLPVAGGVQHLNCGVSRFFPNIIICHASICQYSSRRSRRARKRAHSASRVDLSGRYPSCNDLCSVSTLREETFGAHISKAQRPDRVYLLERITLLWRRLSFSWKVSARNLFRFSVVYS